MQSISSGQRRVWAGGFHFTYQGKQREFRQFHVVGVSIDKAFLGDIYRHACESKVHDPGRQQQSLLSCQSTLAVK